MIENENNSLIKQIFPVSFAFNKAPGMNFMHSSKSVSSEEFIAFSTSIGIFYYHCLADGSSVDEFLPQAMIALRTIRRDKCCT